MGIFDKLENLKPVNTWRPCITFRNFLNYTLFWAVWYPDSHVNPIAEWGPKDRNISIYHFILSICGNLQYCPVTKRDLSGTWVKCSQGSEQRSQWFQIQTILILRQMNNINYENLLIFGINPLFQYFSS